MNLKDLKSNWEAFGNLDPMWAILTNPQKKGNKWEVAAFFRTGEQEAKATIRFLENKKILPHRGVMLDFGCGIGRLTQGFAPFFEKVHGVDIAASMIALAREKNAYGDRCVYHVNSTSNLRLFENQSFDFIYSNITLQHIHPRYGEQYIRAFGRILKQGGVLLFQMPTRPLPRWLRLAYNYTPRFLVNIYRKIRYGINHPIMEVYCIPKTKMVKILSSAGMEVIDIASYQSAGPDWESYRYCAIKK